ncbi:hypothetical protein A2U01_0050743 [Trifolium medium]|uniref:Uncharacterized protein n=1 Tax=Trifolium medium TaxID=97028 RepID=A0A392R0B2_9FABA|nr:hypothetical protein [Trifolium medium]
MAAPPSPFTGITESLAMGRHDWYTTGGKPPFVWWWLCSFVSSPPEVVARFSLGGSILCSFSWIWNSFGCRCRFRLNNLRFNSDCLPERASLFVADVAVTCCRV